MMNTNTNSTVDATDALSLTGLSPFSIASDDLLNTVADFDIHTCPTPLYLGNCDNYNPFIDEDNTEVMALLNGANDPNNSEQAMFSTFSDGTSPAVVNDCMLSGDSNDFNNLTAVSPSKIFGSMMTENSVTSSTLHQEQQYQQHSSTPIASGSTSFDYSNNTFVPINEAVIKREEDNQTPLFTSTSEMLLNSSNNSDSKSKSGRIKEKCMTRNAILARQNREKKKTEQKSITKKLEQLEEENALLKKRCHEYKSNLENAQARVTTLEAALQNLPQILDIIDHVKLLKSNPNVKGSASSSKKT